MPLAAAPIPPVPTVALVPAGSILVVLAAVLRIVAVPLVAPVVAIATILALRRRAFAPLFRRIPAVAPAILVALRRLLLATPITLLRLGRASLAPLPPSAAPPIPVVGRRLSALTAVVPASAPGAVGRRLRACPVPPIVRIHSVPVLPQLQDLVPAPPDPALAIPAQVAELGTAGTHLDRTLPPVADVALR